MFGRFLFLRSPRVGPRYPHFSRSTWRANATASSQTAVTLWRKVSEYSRPNYERQSSRSQSRIILLSFLTTGVPIAFSEAKGDAEITTEEEITTEKMMLKVSMNEGKDVEPPDLDMVIKLYRTMRFFFDTIFLEPFATGVRFIQLMVIFMPVVATVPIIWFGKRVRSRDNERSGTLWWYGFLVFSMERAGATFIKLGQWAASRSDIFPPELCGLLSSLHSNAPAHPMETTRNILSASFNNLALEDIFEDFDEKPLGVGAIAQVYKAKLRPNLRISDDGSDKNQSFQNRVKKRLGVLIGSDTSKRIPSFYVAVKVLHPGVEKLVERDLRIMTFFAALINQIPTMEWLSFPDEVSQFREMMRLQLDLRIEAANLAIFREHFKSRSTTWFPFPYSQYSTREVLVEEFAMGLPLNYFLENGGGIFQKEIAQEGLDSFLHMLLLDNFTHADLHPGNIMVRFYKPNQLELTLQPHHQLDFAQFQDQTGETEAVLSRLRPLKSNPKAWNAMLSQIYIEGYRPQIIFIDTGLVTELNATNRRNFIDLFRAIAEFDGFHAGELMVERCRQPDVVIEPEIFSLKMQHLVLAVKTKTFALGNVKIGDILNQVLTMVRAHHVRLEGDFVNVVISCLLLEGIGRSLDPDLDLFKSALPILRQLGSGSLKSVRQGDTSMLLVWMGLEARMFMQTSVSSVEQCVKYDLLSPNI